MAQSKMTLAIRLPEKEKAILDRYCEEFDRGYTDLIREFIRSLESKIDRAETDVQR